MSTHTPPVPPRSPLVRAADRARLPEESQVHPLNPLSEIHGYALSQLVGLQRTGVYLLRIPPGKESFVYHSHQLEEEWMYVLSERTERLDHLVRRTVGHLFSVN